LLCFDNTAFIVWLSFVDGEMTVGALHAHLGGSHGLAVIPPRAALIIDDVGSTTCMCFVASSLVTTRLPLIAGNALGCSLEGS
jgi:hypothetical protein